MKLLIENELKTDNHWEKKRYWKMDGMFIRGMSGGFTAF